MEILWMAVISVAAVAAAIIIGDKLDTQLCLKLEVRDRAKLQKQIEEIVEEGIRFAEDSYCKGMVPLQKVKPLAAEYVRSIMKDLYRTRVVGEEGSIEALIEERINCEKDLENEWK